jgi:hypothetical protein
MVKRHFGEEAAAAIYANLPTFTRGKKAGKVKGTLHWDNVTTGGWAVRNDRGTRMSAGGVLRPGIHNVCIQPGEGWEYHTQITPLAYENDAPGEYVYRIVCAIRQVFRLPALPEQTFIRPAEGRVDNAPGLQP